MTRDQQLAWEAKWGAPAAAAAILAGAALLVSAMLFVPEDRDGVERSADLLLSIDEQSSGYLASAILGSVAALLLIGVFLYLFYTVQARGGGVPTWFMYLIVAGPLMFAVSTTLGAFDAIDIADSFTNEDGPVRGEAGDERAQELGGASALLVGLATAGTVGLAFLFVMLPLRARRVGLLTPFMGILGVVAGALVVFQLTGISAVIQAFWLVALGLLFLGRWPGGRGPAWESGNAEPWPTAAQRRGLAPLPAEDQAEEARLDPNEPLPEPEAAPERPASRKRRKKR